MFDFSGFHEIALILFIKNFGLKMGYIIDDQNIFGHWANDTHLVPGSDNHEMCLALFLDYHTKNIHILCNEAARQVGTHFFYCCEETIFCFSQVAPGLD